MILRAKTVLPMSGPPLDNGAVVVDGDRVVAVGPVGDVCAVHTGAPRDLGDVVLAPGLINAHCHLDYTRLCGEVAWHGSFIQWLLQLVALKQMKPEADWLSGLSWGIEQLRQSGTTTVVNCAAFPELIARVADGGLRIIWCPELIDFNRDQTAEEILQAAAQFVDARPGCAGFAPHAPYTVSAALYSLAAGAAKTRGVCLSTHVAESAEEDDMFRRGSGPMYDYFLRAGRDMGDCKRVGAVQLLNEAGVLGPNCLAVHANCLTPPDVQLLARTGTPVVHCPLTHRFFGRGVPLLKSLWQAGVTVCLGTDSLASHSAGSKLNLLEEMQALAHVFPDLSAERILQMATLDAARALGRAGQLGELTPGAAADLIALPDGSAGDDPYETVVFAEQPVTFAMVAGKVVVG